MLTTYIIVFKKEQKMQQEQLSISKNMISHGGNV